MKISMRKLLVLVILVCSKDSFASTNEKYVDFLVDLIDSFEKPTDVAAFLCWDLREKASFTKHLGSLEHAHSVKFVNRPNTVTETEAKNCLLITDISCPGTKEFLLMANNTDIFKSPYRWLVIGPRTTGSDVDAVHPELKYMYVPFNSEFFIVREKAQDHFDVQLIYKLLVREIWLVEHYGIWTSESGFSKSEFLPNTISRRRNLHREPLTVNFVVDEIKTGLHSTDYDYMIQNAAQTLSKWGYREVMPLFDFVNAARTNFFSRGWGFLVNGSWTGLMGDLTWGPADLCGTVIFMKEERLDYVTYLTNTITTEVKFVFREPPLSYQNNLFLLPFATAVWLSIAGFVVLVAGVIYLTAQWERKKIEISNGGDGNNFSDGKLTMSDVALMITAAVTQQGSLFELRGPIGRLVTFMLLLTFLLLYTAYAASIIVLLQSSSKQIRTLSDLLNSRLELGVENNSYTRHYFPSASDPVRKAIYEKKVAKQGYKPNFMSLEEGVRKLQKQLFAFHMNVGDGYSFVDKFFFEHEKCGLQEVDYFAKQKLWLTCRRSSPYAELFKIGYSRIREHGLSDQANRVIYSKKPACIVSAGKFDSVSMVDVSPPLAMLLYGALLASALLTAELVLHRLRSQALVDTDSRASRNAII